ncbi:MAG: ATP-binding protein [Actinomycetota bacterium]
MTLRTLFLRNVAVAALIPLFALALFLWQDLERAGRAALDRELVFEATVARQLLADRPRAEVEAKLRTLQSGVAVRLTVIDAEGKVVGDTEADPTRMENHLGRPEVQQALRDGLGRAERFSSSVGEEMRYLAIAEPARPGAWIYRSAVPLTTLNSQIWRAQMTALIAIGIGILFALVAANRLTRSVVGPVEALSEAAIRFSEGEPRPKVTPNGPDALKQLGVTFNTMVERIDTQVRSLDEAQGYLDAVIRQMPEGLLVLDSAGVITRANAAAERLVGLPSQRILGRSVLGVLLNYSLDTEVRRVLQGMAGAMVEVRAADHRALRAAVGPLAIQGNPAGAVVLLEDVSELRRADDMRRDFVANVSHELRTPVAAIRALVETIILRGERRPELVAEYGPRIVSECERIDQLVNDLLLLAQTEAGQLHLKPEVVDPLEVAEEAVRLVETASGAGATLCLEQFTGGSILVDRGTLCQCLRNLADNAVRYAPGGTVRLGSRLEGEQVVLYVADNGPGIPTADIPRVFERFYRVDKARSREVGGSGLGLSIVRRLAELQGGRAWVESQPGTGSTFYLAFPAAAAAGQPMNGS